MELEVQFEWIAGISRHKLGSEALHRSQIFLRHFDEVMFATKGMRKVAAIHSDPRAAQRAKLQELRVIARDRMSTHWAKGRLHHAKHDCYIDNRAAHRTRCILTVSNRNNYRTAFSYTACVFIFS
jgi:hypothetical protein